MFWTYKKVMERINESVLELNKSIQVFPEILEFVQDKQLQTDAAAVGWNKDFKEQATNQFMKYMEMKYPAWWKATKESFRSQEALRVNSVNCLFGHIAYSRLQEICGKKFNRMFIDPCLFNIFQEVVPKGLTIDNVDYRGVPVFLYFPNRIPVLLHRDLRAYVSEVCIMPTGILSWPAEDGDEQMLSTKHIMYLESESADGTPKPASVLWNLETTHVLHHKGVLLTEAFKNEFDDNFEINDGNFKLQKLTKVVINMILYMTSNSPDILNQLNPEYEKSLKKLYTQTGRAKKRRQERLKNIPKNEYFVFGSTLELLQRRLELDHPDTMPIPSDPMDSKEPGESTGKKYVAHVRSGHWKWQVCGPQAKQHKLIFVKPYRTHGPEKETVGYYVTT
jgi:hypothetical protein